jgi:hypothetical protein
LISSLDIACEVGAEAFEKRYIGFTILRLHLWDVGCAGYLGLPCLGIFSSSVVLICHIETISRDSARDSIAEIDVPKHCTFFPKDDIQGFQVSFQCTALSFSRV